MNPGQAWRFPSSPVTGPPGHTSMKQGSPDPPVLKNYAWDKQPPD
jgi:hypothetical protein